jgi:hypothetical protein
MRKVYYDLIYTCPRKLLKMFAKMFANANILIIKTAGYFVGYIFMFCTHRDRPRNFCTLVKMFRGVQFFRGVRW